jgi:hypothetical protein
MSTPASVSNFALSIVTNANAGTRRVKVVTLSPASAVRARMDLALEWPADVFSSRMAP